MFKKLLKISRQNKYIPQVRLNNAHNSSAFSFSFIQIEKKFTTKGLIQIFGFFLVFELRWSVTLPVSGPVFSFWTSHGTYYGDQWLCWHMYTGALRTLLPSQLASEYSTRDRVNTSTNDWGPKAKPTLQCCTLSSRNVKKSAGLFFSPIFFLYSPPKGSIGDQSAMNKICIK